MGEQYLQELYSWISSQDPTFKDRYSYNDFAYKMQNNEDYVNSMYNWIGSVDNTFSSRYTPNEFQSKVKGSETVTVTETVTETVVEEPKKKGFLEKLQERAIATESPSTSEEQPSSSGYTETDNPLTRHIDYLRSLSDSDLQDELSEETINKYAFLGDGRDYYSKEEHIAEVEKEIARREEEKAREGETELERSERLQREIEQTLNITPSTEQADDAFVPTPEGVATQDRGTAFTPTIQTPSEDVSQETADAQDAGQQAAVQVEIAQYELNQQEARKMNESEGIENFQVETIETSSI